jgi:O-antigen ligase
VIAIVAYCSVALAVLQVFGGSGYVYATTNRGNGVGLFANSNHFGSFMLIALALVGGQWIQSRPSVHRIRPAMAKGRVLAAILAPFALGVFLSNSLACTLLLFPVAAGVYFLYRPQTRIYWPVVFLALPVMAMAMVWLLASGWLSNDLMAKSGTIGISRGEFLVNGIAMAQSFAPFGSGLGTFREIYPWFEKLGVVGTTFVNHAHNDLLELVIETGLVGIGVLAVFLYWYVTKLRRLWSSERERNPVAVAASIAVGAVLVHSLADYPLRTAAISGLVAACLVMMCREPEGFGAATGSKRIDRSEPVTI